MEKKKMYVFIRLNGLMIWTTLVFGCILAVKPMFAQQSYRYDVIATSSSSLQVFAAPSINNNGEISFAGRRIPGGGAIFTDFLPNNPRDLIPGFSGQPSFTASGQTQINDSRQILSWWLNSSTFPPQNYIHVIDGKAIGIFTNVAAANGTGGFNDFNEIYASGIAFNSNGRPVFQTRNGSFTTILTSGVRPNFATLPFPISQGPILRPMISDSNIVVVRNGNSGNDPILSYPVGNLFESPTTIASIGVGFSQIGQSPSVSRNAEAIAFYADLDQAGATVLGTNAGPGIFVSIKMVNGQRKIVRVAGRLVEDISAPGGNDDGVCDPGEVCVQGELGSNLAGDRIFFNSFEPDSRIDIAFISSGKPGLEDDLVMVSFIATPNIASDIPGRIFTNQTGLWTQTAKITANDGTVYDPQKALKVAQVGDVIGGNTLTQIQVYDQIANNVERVAFWAGSSTGNMIIRAVRDPGIPVIFVPGVGGSELRHPSTGARLWFPESISDDVTPLAINNPVNATDAMRKFKVGLVAGFEQEQEVYLSLLNALKDSGYIEYNLDGDISRLNETCGGQNLDELRAKHPTLFVFPYDWRKSNGDAGPDGNVGKLKKYVQCIRAIYPDTDVNIVAHSMGGLLSRSYILQNPNEHYVENLITIGSPWLGATKAMYSLETGSFLSDAFYNGSATKYWLPDLLFAPQIKQIIEGFPGAHQLLPSQKYFELGGRPLRIDATDYGYVQVRDWINSRHSAFNPGTNGEIFHTLAQDDFRNDTTGVNYYHIYGRQPRNLTVGRIEPRNRYIRYLLPSFVRERIYLDFNPVAVAGDGTVPILSASRRIDGADGLNATCGNSNDSKCIGVCYDESADPLGELSQHNGMTSNPQVQSQVVQILQFVNGFRPTNPSFETTSCHLPPNQFGSGSGVESHYVTMTGIKSVLITDGQGNNNAAVSTAYKRIVPGVSETIVGSDSIQVITRVDNTYTMRFTGNGEPLGFENIRGASNEISDATYIVRYDDVLIEQGVVAELRIVNDQVESLKYDSNGDGTPDTVIPPSRIITDPQNADLQAPDISVSWRASSVRIDLSDNDSGVRRMFVRRCVSGQCTEAFQEISLSSFSMQVSPFTTGIEVVSEDNAGNRSDVTFFQR